MALTSAFTTSTTNGNKVSVTDQSTAGTSPITTYDTDWGDGSAHATSASPSHTYATAGTYTITHVVGDGTTTASATASVTVQIPPTASFTVSVSGLTVTVTDTSTAGTNSPAHTIASYNTDWGDGSAHATTNPCSHTYGLGGFLIGHGVTDSAGLVSSQYTDLITDGTADDGHH